jgi:hypothetical protein
VGGNPENVYPASRFSGSKFLAPAKRDQLPQEVFELKK